MLFSGVRGDHPRGSLGVPELSAQALLHQPQVQDRRAERLAHHPGDRAEQERLDLLKKAQEDAQSLFAKTKRESETYLQEQKHIAEQKVEQMLTQAQGTIESERRKMLAEAKTEVAGLVVATTERVLKDVLTDEVRTQLNKKASEVLASEGSNS